MEELGKGLNQNKNIFEDENTNKIASASIVLWNQQSASIVSPTSQTNQNNFWPTSDNPLHAGRAPGISASRMSVDTWRINHSTIIYFSGFVLWVEWEKNDAR